MKTYQLVALIGGFLEISLFIYSNYLNLTFFPQIILLPLIIVITSIPFAIRNSRIAGIGLIIVVTTKLIVSYAYLLTNDTIWSTLIVYFIFLSAGILALVSREDSRTKRRKGLSAIISLLENIHNAHEWNERSHEVYALVRKNERIVSPEARRRIDEISNYTSPDEWIRYMLLALEILRQDKPTESIHGPNKMLMISALIAVIGISLLVLLISAPKTIAFPNWIICFVTGCDIPNNNDDIPNNNGPIKIQADAGSNKEISENDLVILDGTKSKGRGTINDLSYNWNQIGDGPRVTIHDSNEVKATFRSPEVNEDEELEFELAVYDSYDNSDSDEVTILVLDTDLAMREIDLRVSASPEKAHRGQKVIVEASIYDSENDHRISNANVRFDADCIQSSFEKNGGSVYLQWAIPNDFEEDTCMVQVSAEAPGYNPKDEEISIDILTIPDVDDPEFDSPPHRTGFEDDPYLIPDEDPYPHTANGTLPVDEMPLLPGGTLGPFVNDD